MTSIHDTAFRITYFKNAKTLNAFYPYSLLKSPTNHMPLGMKNVFISIITTLANTFFQILLYVYLIQYYSRRTNRCEHLSPVSFQTIFQTIFLP